MEVSVHAYGGSPAQQACSKRPAGKTANGFLENVIRTQASQGGLDGVYSRLSPASQKALEGLKAGRSDMTRDQWTALCRELKDLGAITQAEFDYTGTEFRLHPVFTDSHGNVTCPGARESFDLLTGRGVLLQNESAAWKGDPLAYLDAWAKTFERWKSQYAGERWPDGEKKYEDLSPLDRRIDAFQKVAELLRGLTA